MAHDTLPPPPVNLSVRRQADHYGVYHGGARATSKADVPMSHLISVIRHLPNCTQNSIVTVLKSKVELLRVLWEGSTGSGFL